MPEPQWHAALSAAVFVSARRAGLRPGVAAATSVFIDVDHFTDMAYFRRTGRRDIQLVPLHSWELACLGLLSRRRVVRAAAAGALAHLLSDWLLGGYRFRQLSLGYRIAKRFRTGTLGDWVLWPHGPRGWGEILHSGSAPTKTD